MSTGSELIRRASFCGQATVITSGFLTGFSEDVKETVQLPKNHQLATYPKKVNKPFSGMVWLCCLIIWKINNEKQMFVIINSFSWRNFCSMGPKMEITTIKKLMKKNCFQRSKMVAIVLPHFFIRWSQILKFTEHINLLVGIQGKASHTLCVAWEWKS